MAAPSVTVASRFGFGDLGQHLHSVCGNAHRDGNVFGRSRRTSASTGTLTGGQVVGQATAGTVVTSSGSPSLYQSSVTFTATINGEYGQVKGNKAKPEDVTGTVAWSAEYLGCGTTAVTSGNPGIATCTTSALPTGSDTVTANYLGDTNHSPSNGSFVQTVTCVPDDHRGNRSEPEQ